MKSAALVFCEEFNPSTIVRTYGAGMVKVCGVGLLLIDSSAYRYTYKKTTAFRIDKEQVVIYF